MKATFILPSVIESTLEGCRAAARIAYTTYFFAAVHVLSNCVVQQARKKMSQVHLDVACAQEADGDDIDAPREGR